VLSAPEYMSSSIFVLEFKVVMKSIAAQVMQTQATRSTSGMRCSTALDVLVYRGQSRQEALGLSMLHMSQNMSHHDRGRRIPIASVPFPFHEHSY